MRTALKAIVIGASAGGFNALHKILPMFRADFMLPIIVVLHRRADLESFFVKSLDDKCLLPVKEPLDKTKIEPGNIYIAPGGYHLLVEKDYHFSLSVDPPVCYCRPSIDVLFESAAEAFGTALVGIILTGANFDGSRGIKTIKSSGGITIAQNPDTAEVNYMPYSAIKTNSVDHILNLDEIPGLIEKLLDNKTYG
ncbi:MAG: chemotaxis protein CheB [Desulfamplus sp.]|nr:chemotaxis protein CheB [Desulfamplus sp.]MBF0257721.1 chemotaxis protein CheB [Desulfamplus sp.]